MTESIAPNSQLPSTHFIEVWSKSHTYQEEIKPINILDLCCETTFMIGGNTIAIFRIRENKLPTKHKF